MLNPLDAFLDGLANSTKPTWNHSEKSLQPFLNLIPLDHLTIMMCI